jgi:hypothetical protein
MAPGPAETWGHTALQAFSGHPVSTIDRDIAVSTDARASGPGTPGARETSLTRAVLWLSAGVILAHFVLVFGAGWGGDEFFNIAIFRQNGLNWLVVRMLEWSPRPASDFVLYLYALAVNHWHMPLIAPFLATLWGILFASMILAARQPGSPDRAAQTALALSVGAMFLLGHGLNDLFFWPMGAAPYLLDLAGITVVTFQIISGGVARPAGQWACALGLALAATSSETGLFFALIFTVALVILHLLAWPRSSRADSSRQAWFVVPLAISLAVAACLACIVRNNPMRGIDAGSAYFHHFWPSLAATMAFAVPDMFWRDGGPAGIGWPAALVSDALLFAGFVWGCRVAFCNRLPGREMAALAAALLSCFTLTIFTSYFEYSERVHEPQTAFRRCLVVLGLLAAARLAGPIADRRRHLLQRLGPMALLGAIAIGFVLRLPGLMNDYALIPDMRAARTLTWQSGLDPTTATLRYVPPPQGEVLHGLIPSPPGRFVRGAPGIEWWMTGLMDFFNKRGLEFAPLPAHGG